METKQEFVKETEWAKIYHSEVHYSIRSKARSGKLVSDDGECWSYYYTHTDANGEYDLLFRHVLIDNIRVIRREDLKEKTNGSV